MVKSDATTWHLRKTQVAVSLSESADMERLLNVTPSVTDWLTAIGTVGAVIVALSAPAVRRWLLWRRRPIPEVIVGNEEPYVDWTVGGGGIQSGVGRIEVANRGKTEATGVTARITTIWDHDNTEDKWREQKLVPLQLRWLPTDESIAPIAPSGSAYFQIVSWAKDHSTIWIGSEGSSFVAAATPGKFYRVAIELVGTNFPIATQVVEFLTGTGTGTGEVGAFVLSQAPKSTEPGGLVGMSRVALDEIRAQDQTE